MSRVFAAVFLAGLLSSASHDCAAQSGAVVKVPSHVWAGLAQEERDSVISRYVVDLVSSDSVGVIIDAQGVDRSDPGTTAGQQLGAAFGSAAYVDNAFRGRPDYSAKNHLGASLLGALLGGAIDRPPSTRYQFRYSVKTLANSIEYLDDHTAEPFRKSIGACVSIPSLAAVPQDLCSETADSFRRKFMPSPSNPPLHRRTSAAQASPAESAPQPALAADVPAQTVKCKFGNNSPVAIDIGVCQLGKGEVLP